MLEVLRIDSPIATDTHRPPRSLLHTFPASQLPYNKKRLYKKQRSKYTNLRDFPFTSIGEAVE